MRRRVSKRELLRRIESIEERLALPAPEPLEGQQTIPVATIGDHTYLGPGPCRETTFTVVCGAHRDAHQLIDEDDLP
ncbi:hypothetical protein SUDANB145_07256 (plasmid) [Streptomyces sp. enrichment culture]|uniref:hypothetical protein n=1 Tax=Streptomyces sp. enrichment culture TaxID=1795815 RepID=UPI003F54B76F